MPRQYRLGKRQASVDRTRDSILAAARRLASGRPWHEVSVGAVARLAGVSRLSVYGRFGSKAALFEALARPRVTHLQADQEPREALRQRFAESCARWSADPALQRNLAFTADATEAEADRVLAERLAAADQLRPGCSIKEAEDVIGALASFPVFDRLHKDGRRSATTVADILMRLSGAILS